MTKRKKNLSSHIQPDPDLRRLITKTTVATEILFLIRNGSPELESWAAATVIRAFDESDFFWDSRQHHTLDNWLQTLKQLADKYAARDAGRNSAQPGRKYDYHPERS